MGKLKKIDSLQQDIQQQSDSVILNGLPFILAFRTFASVVDSCFGVSLKSGYEDAIRKFKEAYLSLDITVTPKVYIGQRYIILKNIF